VYIPCDNENPLQLPINTTPTPTPVVKPSPTPDDNEEHKVLVYRGMNSTAPSEWNRIDPPQGKDWHGGFSAFERLIISYKYELPFVVTYKGKKEPYKTVGVVIGALKDGTTFIGGGSALYTPGDGNAAIGDEHWSVNFTGISVNELKSQLSQFAKKYFDVKSK
jgi:hypothetical protein